MTRITGHVTAVNGNMVSVRTEGVVSMNEVAYILSQGKRLKSEIIRIRGDIAQMQVYEITKGILVGDRVEFTGEMLSVELGPGLLGMIYDGLQNPLPEIAEESGYFLEPGVYHRALKSDKVWAYTPVAKPGDVLRRGDLVGTVPEGNFAHRIMLPFDLYGDWTVVTALPAGEYSIDTAVVVVADSRGNRRDITMRFTWPVKRAVDCYARRLKPVQPMFTRTRIIDTFFPVAKGGTYCIPGPFGAGKTVLQQVTSRNADVDVVIIAACGERAGEVVDTLKEFPLLIDPRTGRSLMERTIIICNTSSMPVAAREASVYTAVTLAEYYRQMGLDVLLLADSTSRWAQAMREMSGRLEEIPGEEAFPAYLESVIASFYERAGIVRLSDGSTGSITIGGTVSPAGGNFDEPVTQATLKVVGAFHGLSRERSDARKYPAIHPLDSWSKYTGIMPAKAVAYAHGVLERSSEVGAMMKVVGEEGTSLEDYIVYLKGEFLDSAYLQQNSFDPVDASVTPERQKEVFKLSLRVLAAELRAADKEDARVWFYGIRQSFLDMNGVLQDSPKYAEIFSSIEASLAERSGGESPEGRSALASLE